mmetsp:Transcript_37765/g.119308  ORF Transcript_37765/g.119308 Transcript_37765/m.119308 type:complete len:113 (+) Transcript_37765:609-947(+)
MEEEPEEHLDDYGGVSEEEDYEEPPPPPVNMRRGRRDTVYLAATKVEDDWRPPEFPKTDEERDRIHKVRSICKDGQGSSVSTELVFSTLKKRLCCPTSIHPPKTWLSQRWKS